MSNWGLLPINGILIGIVCLEALGIMIYWWVKTRGSWMEWRAGRSLMGLLAIIVFVTGNAVINLFFVDDYLGKRWVYASLYAVMILALAGIWFAIRYELRTGGQSSRLATGPTPIIRAKEENNG